MPFMATQVIEIRSEDRDALLRLSYHPSDQHLGTLLVEVHAGGLNLDHEVFSGGGDGLPAFLAGLATDWARVGGDTILARDRTRTNDRSDPSRQSCPASLHRSPRSRLRMGAERLGAPTPSPRRARRVPGTHRDRCEDSVRELLDLAPLRGHSGTLAHATVLSSGSGAGRQWR